MAARYPSRLVSAWCQARMASRPSLAPSSATRRRAGTKSANCGGASPNSRARAAPELLLGLQSCRLGDARELGDLALDVSGKLLRRAPGEVETLSTERRLDVIACQHLHRFGVQAADDRRRRPGRGEEGEPRE